VSTDIEKLFLDSVRGCHRRSARERADADERKHERAARREIRSALTLIPSRVPASRCGAGHGATRPEVEGTEGGRKNADVPFGEIGGQFRN
jgi:hypothetical protein